MRIENSDAGVGPDNGNATDGQDVNDNAAQTDNASVAPHLNDTAQQPAATRPSREYSRRLAVPSRATDDDEESDVVDVSQIGAMLRRRRKALLTTFLAVLALGALYTWLQKPVYEATGDDPRQHAGR